MLRSAFLFMAFLLYLQSKAQPAKRYDLVIHEIMADPSPSIGLPEAEYIELKNRTSTAINLQAWRISTSSTTSGTIGSFVLQPDSLIILCAAAQVASLSQYGTALSVPSFPSLSNEGTLLTLVSKEGRIIHAVPYQISWYGNEAKAAGGRSLEMIDAGNPCSGQNNWTASTHARGGTPGAANAVASTNSDVRAPTLLHAFVPDLNQVVLVWDEPVDSITAVNAAYQFRPFLAVSGVRPFDALQQQFAIQLTLSMDSGTLYTIHVPVVQDCSGNAMRPLDVQTGIPTEPAARDIVVNEILYQPRPGSHDYVELYNRSRKVIDLSQLYLANKNSNGSIGSLRRIAGSPRYLLPDAYVVITEDAAALATQYLVRNETDVLVVSSMPSYPNDAGTVVLADFSGSVIDAIAYHKDWQFALISNDEGVALERLDPAGLSQESANWHSAAASAGYGTPGYRNSQYLMTEHGTSSLSVFPKLISPDNDGHEDVAMISYRLEEPGYAGNVYIFNAEGVLQRHLVKSAILGKEGTWQWDGLNEKRNQLPAGPYIIVAEFFNLQGRKRQFRQVVVLAGKR